MSGKVTAFLIHIYCAFRQVKGSVLCEKSETKRLERSAAILPRRRRRGVVDQREEAID